MKFSASKITSVTLLTSMLLSAVSPPVMPIMAYGNETEMSEMAAVETEEIEIETAGELYVLGASATENQPVAGTETTGETTESEVRQEKATEQVSTENETTERTSMETEVTEQASTETETAKEQLTESAQTETAGTENIQAPETGGDENKEITVSEEAIEEQTENQTGKKETETAEELNGETKVIEPVTVDLELEPSEPTEECPDPEGAGLSQKLKVTAVNPTQGDAELRLYFWDYSGKESDGER